MLRLEKSQASENSEGDSVPRADFEHWLEMGETPTPAQHRLFEVFLVSSDDGRVSLALIMIFLLFRDLCVVDLQPLAANADVHCLRARLAAHVDFGLLSSRPNLPILAAVHVLAALLVAVALMFLLCCFSATACIVCIRSNAGSFRGELCC